MSIQNIPSTRQATPPLQTASKPPELVGSPHANGLAFDRFQRNQTEPDIRISLPGKIAIALLNPIKTVRFLRTKLPPGNSESVFQRVKMYNTLRRSLDSTTAGMLKDLLKQGVLNDADTDCNHSTLYNLYAMLKTRRAPGYDNQILTQQTIALLHKPYLINQKFAPLTEKAGQEILQVRNNPGLNRAGEAPPDKYLRWEDLQVGNSATCVASSVMYYMADKKPGELVRHLNELTSPLEAFFEKARLDEISPDDPRQATEILKQHHIKYYFSGPNELTLKVEIPKAGTIRAIDSQRVPTDGKYRNAVESAYQSALTYLSTRTYDPAIDLRDSDIPGEGSKGLTEPEKTLMETIIKDNGGVQSVTYQAVARKADPQPGEENLSYLYGYTRSFENTTADIMEALKMNEFVIIGITDTDETGAIVGGHEITITGAFVDKKDGELKFIVADSDDNVPTLVVRTARELIPRIHHAGMPLKLAQKINQEIAARPGYLVPGPADTRNFNLMARNMDPMPVEEPAEQQEQPAPEPAAANPTSQQPATTSPNPPQTQTVEWVPVLQYPTGTLPFNYYSPLLNPNLTGNTATLQAPAILPARPAASPAPGSVPGFPDYRPVASYTLPLGAPQRPIMPGSLTTNQALPQLAPTFNTSAFSTATGTNFNLPGAPATSNLQAPAPYYPNAYSYRQ